MSTVEFKNIRKSYGAVEVVKGFDLKVSDGEFVSFLGPSGCGKTTCLRMISGLEENTSGELSLGGDVVSDPDRKIYLSPEERNVGMVFQSYAVWPHMNVFENIAYPLKIQKINTIEIKNRVEEVMNVVELSGLEGRMPNQLSGGQQQRVALARGLVARPRVLLLDEPLSNLDAKLRDKMRIDIRAIQQKLKFTCVYVTHDQLEAFSMSDRILIMNEGIVQQVGTPEEIRESPANQFVQDFIKQSH
jgi:iron(III) transport system ATP-binding protein